MGNFPLLDLFPPTQSFGTDPVVRTRPLICSGLHQCADAEGVGAGCVESYIVDSMLRHSDRSIAPLGLAHACDTFSLSN